MLGTEEVERAASSPQTAEEQPPWQWQSATKKGAKGDINVTPLIDIVLVLLIIFMVLVPSMLKELTRQHPQEGHVHTPPDPNVRARSSSSTPPSGSCP